MYSQGSGLSLLEQKRLQWAREREEMMGLGGLWGSLDKCNRDPPPTSAEPMQPRRNSLLPPIQTRSDEQKEKEEESETSGYLSDSPQHECDSSTDSRSHAWSGKRENYWVDRKTQKNLRNESRLRGTPDSLLSTPEDRLKWGDRGVGVGHLWEPVVEMPDSRLPQVFESFRATPRWLERKLADSNKADILVIQHDEEERPHSNFILGQNAPLPPEVLEERERKRRKALELQNAIRRQLEERDRKRKEDKENRMREERLEEERIMKERELERFRREDELRKIREKENIEKRKEEAMKEALEEAERKAKEEKKKQRKRDGLEELEKINEAPEFTAKEQKWRPVAHTPRIRREEPVLQEAPKTVKDSSCQAEEEVTRQVTDSSSQSDCGPSLQFLNMGGVAEGGLALVLEGGAPGGLLVPQDAVQLLLMSPGQAAGALPVQMSERVLTPSMLRGSRVVMDATTQTDRKCCSVALSSERSRRCRGRNSGRSETSEKSSSLERVHSHSHCTSSRKHRSRSQPRASLGDRPKWGINRPSVQYMKQSEKDPHYLRRLKRRGRRTKEAATSMGPVEEKLLESEFRLLAFQTDDEMEIVKKQEEPDDRILENGFRMLSNPSSPKFVRIGERIVVDREFEVTTIESTEDCQETEEYLQELCLEGQAPLEEGGDSKEVLDDEDVTVANMVIPSELSAKDSNTAPMFERPADNELESLDFLSTTLETPSNVDPKSSECESSEGIEVFSLNKENEAVPGDVVVYPVDEVKLENCEGEEGKSEEFSSAPSTGRSVSKSDGNDGDDDLDDDDDDEDNKSVVSASHPNPKVYHMEAISQIAALKIGLQRLINDVDSRCSTPASSIGDI